LHDIKFRQTQIDVVLTAPVVFICVPTPTTPDGQCNSRIVEEVVKELAGARYDGLAVIKSTVLPGTTESWFKKYDVRLAFCPEFLRERAAERDFVEGHDVCIAGVFDEYDFDLIKQAHGSLPKVFVQLTPTEAELTKYFSNVFNALRIVFACQFYDVCQKLGVDYTAVKSAIVHRHNIGDHYLDANAQLRAFAGSCLPKDTHAFAAFVKSLGVDAPLFKTIVDINRGM